MFPSASQLTVDSFICIQSGSSYVCGRVITPAVNSLCHDLTAESFLPLVDVKGLTNLYTQDRKKRFSLEARCCQTRPTCFV